MNIAKVPPRLCTRLCAVVLLLLGPAANAMYDPGTQRWISRDPLADDFVINTEGVLGNNLYVFVQNQPVALVDTDGRGLIGLIKCFYQMMKWKEQCLKNLPDCTDPCLSDDEMIDCMTKRSKAIANCMAQSRQMFKDCLNGVSTPPVGPRR